MIYISPSFADVPPELPVVLHTRCVTQTGGGPDKTIINSPRYLPPLGYRALCAYFHPPTDIGFETLVGRARQADASIIGIKDRGIMDLSVVSRLIDLCRTHNVRIWHGHDYKSNVIGLLVRRFLPLALVTTAHGWGVQHTARLKAYYALDRWTLKHYEQVIAVSQDIYRDAIRAGVPEDRCHHIHNAIDVEQFRRRLSAEEAKSVLGAPVDGILVGAVGRLSREKGFDLLIRAAGALIRSGTRIALWIAGEGPERGNLEQLINELELQDYVRLVGFLDDTKVFYQALDVYVLSSLREGLPNSVLEAMALEAPVLATRIAGVPSLVENGCSGMLIEPGSAEALAEGMVGLIESRKLRSQLAASARARIESEFSFDVRMRKVAAVYDVVMRSKSAKGRGWI